MGRRNHTKGNRAKTVIAALAVVITGAVAGSAIVLAGGSAEAAAVETPQLCSAGEQVVESVVPLRGADEPICLPISEKADTSSRIDPNYTRAATTAIAEAATLVDQVEAQDVTVVCWSNDDWARIADWFKAQGIDSIARAFGFVSMPSNVVNLSPSICDKLDEIVYQGARPDTMTASNAVGVIVHEALHTTGIADEGQTECYAMQLTATVAAELGTDDAYGATLADLNLELNTTSRAGSVYDSPECHAGGSYDLDNNTLWQ